MKIILFKTALLSISFNAVSSPYFGLEYGLGSTNHHVKNNFISSPKTSLNARNEDGTLNFFVGYSLDSQWAIEFGYNQFNLEDDHSEFVRSDIVSVTKEKWDTTVKAKQLILTPIYSHHLNEIWLTKFKLGLTYTQYNLRGAHYFEEEFPSSKYEIITPISQYSKNSNEIGGLISAGTEYEVYPQLKVGINVKHQFDRFANTTSFSFSSTYYY
ncbi:AcfA family outer membrane beta-barrel protein [Vibrio sp. 10N.286.51.B11]|uniref:AcfA family outer membrane beta-barrel protein n=1 Tax=Vibrio TaxID=662 RepID=UPI0010BE1C5F|nr:AcfA family outer membrane beta-barrel protein [Vibrio sp. F13]TKG02858.1 porin family protein [Vibrio sp. F13]